MREGNWYNVYILVLKIQTRNVSYLGTFEGRSVRGTSVLVRNTVMTAVPTILRAGLGARLPTNNGGHRKNETRPAGRGGYE